jgi:hypothetical protein
MTESILNILLFVAMAAVAATLAFGIFNLVKTGPEARSKSNKLMRLRVILQFVAVLILALIYYFKSQSGG